MDEKSELIKRIPDVFVLWCKGKSEMNACVAERLKPRYDCPNSLTMQEGVEDLQHNPNL